MSTKDHSVHNTHSRKSTLQRLVTGMHNLLYRLSGSKVAGQIGASRVLLLTTTGRKSGKPRTTPLFYLPDNGRFILVASNGGSPTHPTWWLNLQANPNAMVQIGNQKLPVTAAQADREERKHLWPLLTKMYSGYADYQKRTTREIPVVILHRVPPNTGS